MSRAECGTIQAALDEAVKGLERIERLTGMRSDVHMAASQTLAKVRAAREASPAGPLTAEEVNAVAAFWEYGATRGNHTGPEPMGPPPGPLTPHIKVMGRAMAKLRASPPSVAAPGGHEPCPLDHTPNAETIAAMEAVDRGEVEPFDLAVDAPGGTAPEPSEAAIEAAAKQMWIEPGRLDLAATADGLRAAYEVDFGAVSPPGGTPADRLSERDRALSEAAEVVRQAIRESHWTIREAHSEWAAVHGSEVAQKILGLLGETEEKAR